ncbi:MAG: ABC-F family ATP-binding cassette domain-containing protein [Nocardioidaceae bacterium]
MSHAIVVNDLRFAWPEGDLLFDGLGFTVGPGRTALVGVNGSGKSTLFRLLTGELAPQGGSLSVEGKVGYLRQDLTLDAGLPVDEVLGIAGVRRALAAIERGEVDEEHFTAVGDDWDVDERARAMLDRLGMTHVGLDRRVGEMSGGEAVLLGFAAQLLRRPDVLLLDEPTNNLDLAARRRLYDAVASWTGVMLMVSHDRELLERVDAIAELRAGRVRTYGGNFTAYEEAVAIAQEAAERTVRAAEADVRRQQRELVEARVKLSRRERYAKKMFENMREPRAVMRGKKRTAQVSAAKHRIMHTEKLDEARERLSVAEDAVRDDDVITVDLPATAVPAGRTVLEIAGAALRNGTVVDLELRGPERVALLGANGSGKTTLLDTVTGRLEPGSGSVRPAVPMRYLPQRLTVLDDAATIVANVARLAPAASDNAIRSRLARFYFRGGRADQIVGTLSGGERFRATLAALMLAEPAPQLLLLDEPTNNLDLASAEQLSQALAAYEGAMIVASHDVGFLRTLGITRWLHLEGTLTEVDPPG